MPTTISANAHAREPVTLCYKRRYKLLPHRTDALTPLPSQPSSYPCPPHYRNQHRLPFVQQQWYREALQDDARLRYEAIEWSVGDEVREVKADWQWSIARVVKKVCRLDGVQLVRGKGKGKATAEAEAEERKGEEEKMGASSMGDEDAQTMSPLIIQVDPSDEPLFPLALTSALNGSLSPPGRVSREEADATAAQPSPRPLRVGIDLDERDEADDAATDDERSALSPRAFAGPPPLPPWSPSSHSSAASSPRSSLSPRTPRRSLTPSQASMLESFNPLPDVFLPSLRVTSGGRTRVVGLAGEGVSLAQLRGEWKWGVREGGRVGVWCVLEVYGYALWVKEEEGRGNAWAKLLTPNHADGEKAQAGVRREKK